MTILTDSTSPGGRSRMPVNASMRRRIFKPASILVLLLTLVALPAAWAQGANSSITGSVLDRSGASVPGAHVTLTDTATNVQRQTVTNGQGLFSFQALPIGTYSIAVSSHGFATAKFTGIVLNTAESRRLPNITLQLAGTESSVQVTAEAVPLAPLDTGESRLTLNTKMISQLSIQGRDALELVKFLPGMAMNTGMGQGEWNSLVTGTNSGPAGQFSANGTQPNGGMTIISDGGNILDPGNQGTQIANVNQAATAQMTILNSSFNAEYPHGPVVIQATGKSGTAQYHGSVYLYARPGQLNAEDAFLKSQRQARPQEHYYYPGFTIGGPVPGLKKKLFFFTNYEYMNQAPAGTLHQYFVPTPEMLAGNFSPDYLKSLGLTGPSAAVPCGDSSAWNYANYCGTASGQSQVSGGVINSSAIDTNALALAKLFPKPNQDPAAHGGYNYAFLDNAPVNRWEYRIRADYDATDNTQLYVSYDRQNEKDLNNIGVWWEPGDTLPYPTKLPAATKANSWSVGVTHIYSPTLTNEVVFAYNSYINPLRPANPSAMNPATIGFTAKGPFNPPITPQIPNLISWGCSQSSTSGCFPGLYGPAFSSGFDSGAFGGLKRVPSVNEGLSWNVGAHLMKFGAYWSSEGNQQTSGYGSWPQGAYEFDNWANNSTGNPLADFLIGHAVNYTQTSAVPVYNMFYNEYALYAQDQWQINPRLTLNYGVRFDHEGQWYWKDSPGLAVWNPASYDNGSKPAAWTGLTWHDRAIMQMGQYADVPNSGFRSPVFTVDPRIGVAYDIFGNGRTVIRGGFGMYRYQVSYNTASSAGGPSLGIANVSTPALNSFANAADFAPSLSTGLFGGITALQMNDNATPYTETWNAIVSEQMPWHSEVELEYTGNRSRNELIASNLSNINLIPMGGLFGPDPLTGVTYAPGKVPSGSYQDYRPFHNYTSMNIIRHGSFANYNAMQVTWQKQQGAMTFMLNYTFSKTLGVRDGQTNDGGGNGAMIDPFNLNANYGVLAYDHTHVFNAAYVINLPSPIHGNFIGEQVLNGWELSGDTQIQSGAPIQPNEGGTLNIVWDGVSNSALLGTDAVTLVPRLTCDPRTHLASGQYFNPSCFAAPTNAQNGNVVWPYIKGPAFFNSDLGLYKNFKMTERQNLQLRFTAFNFLNHPLPQFGLTGHDVNLELGPTGTNVNQLTNGRPGAEVGRRVIELGITYSF